MMSSMCHRYAAPLQRRRAAHAHPAVGALAVCTGVCSSRRTTARLRLVVFAATSPRKPPKVDPGTALEVLSKLDTTAAAKVVGVLEAADAADMLEKAIRFKRWDTQRVAAVLAACPPDPATRILGLMTDSEAVRVLELMDAKATAAVVDRLGALAAVYLLRMDATAAVRAVRRAEATADQLFPDEGERKEYEKRVTVVDGMQEDIEGVEWYLFQAEQMTKGKLQLLNDQGRWEPFKKDGLRGWLLIVTLVLTPLLLVYVTSIDLVEAAKEASKLMGGE